MIGKHGNPLEGLPENSCIGIVYKPFRQFYEIYDKLALYNIAVMWYSVFGCNTKVLERWTILTQNLKFLLVDAQVLPEVFLKVIEAKMLLAQGKAKSSSQAAQMAGISRSAFYKYKDAIYLYDERMSENITTFNLTLEDRPGVLSALLTVNQNIPVDGVAIASVSVRTTSSTLSRSELLDMLAALDGVVEAKAI